MEKNIKKSNGGRNSKYDFSLKRKIVEELYSGTITRSELKRKYNLSSRSTIVGFEKWYEQEQKQMLSSTTMISDKEQQDAAIARQHPDASGGIEEQLRLAQLKIICLETMIDLAEQTLQIDIRKKPGAKPSGE
jgi:transposase